MGIPSRTWSIPRLPTWAAYVLAVGITAAGIAAQHELKFLTQHTPFLLYYLTAFLAAFLGGRGPLVVSVGLAAALANYHFLTPEHQFTTTVAGLAATGAYALVALVIGLLTAQLREAHGAQRCLIDELRLARAKAEEEARLRERLMAILGHDLRQPLSVLRAGAVLLPRVTDPAQAKALVEQLERNAGRIDRMIEQVLDFTRAQTQGTLAVERRPMDLCELCARAVEDARLAFPGHPLVLDLDAQPLSGTWDPERLAQVLTNLLGNACHYGDAAEPVRVRVRAEAQTAVIEVRNGGPPVPAALQPVLFEPFRRGDGHAQRSGLGLGLYIVREIVRAHGGQVALRSSAEEGTVFRVSLPLRRP